MEGIIAIYAIGYVICVGIMWILGRPWKDEMGEVAIEKKPSLKESVFEVFIVPLVWPLVAFYAVYLLIDRARQPNKQH